MDTTVALREFLEFVIGQLIEHPELACVSHEPGASDQELVFRVTLAPSDVGLVVGRSGRAVTALRALLNAAAQRTDLSVRLTVEDAEAAA